MNAGQLLAIGTASLLLFVVAHAQQKQNWVVRMAELEIDPQQIDAYKAALKEEIETSIRVEPGVLALYAVSVKGLRSHIRVFEIYADTKAYNDHLITPHFQRYKVATEKMVKSLKLIETEPIALGAKAARNTQ